MATIQYTLIQFVEDGGYCVLKRNSEKPRELWLTLGPASLKSMPELFRSGVTGVRLTFSFGTPELQLERALKIRDVSREVGRKIKVIADLPGGKMRLGTFSGDANSVKVKAGERIAFRCEASTNPELLPREFAVPDPGWFEMLDPNVIVVIGDNALRCSVLSVVGHVAQAVAVADGSVEQTRGLSIQNGRWVPPCLTDKDRAALAHILASEVYDAVALSFVSSPESVQFVRQAADAAARNDLSIVAKIETVGGIECIDTIAQAADALIVARGDLSLATDWRDIGIWTERVGRAADGAGKPWILATQIAEGFELFDLMTRAEVSDLSHWLRAGCSGVLLSRETVFGPAPIRAVEAVQDIMSRF